jgi:hypothetical protein
MTAFITEIFCSYLTEIKHVKIDYVFSNEYSRIAFFAGAAIDACIRIWAIEILSMLARKSAIVWIICMYVHEIPNFYLLQREELLAYHPMITHLVLHGKKKTGSRSPCLLRYLMLNFSNEYKHSHIPPCLSIRFPTP